jgi:ribonuclease D
MRAEPVVGIDTEAASFHRYHDRIYLVQLSTPIRTAVVDPLSVGGLEPLGGWLGNPETEFVFHDADYDVRLLHHEFGFRVARLFDTRLAAQFLNLPKIGLAGLLEARFGVRTDKRWQRADWSARPLSEEMVAYAATDTRFLPALREALGGELAGRGRLAWVEEECQLTRLGQWAPPIPPDEAYLGVKGARLLDRRGLAILRALYVWRERTAERIDRALFRIVGNETLVVLAQQRPRTLAALESIRGLGRELVHRRGGEILAAIHAGLEVPEVALPRFERRPRTRPDPLVEARLERLRQRRQRWAADYDLPVGLLAPNALLEAIARAGPGNRSELEAIPGIRRWQVAELGDELLAGVRETPG